MLFSSVQKETVNRKPHSSVIESYSYVLLSVPELRHREKKNLPKQDLKKKTTNCRNCNGLIFVLVHFRWKSRYHCLLYSAHFLLEFAQLSLRRRVVSVSHNFTVYIYINNHHHPYVHRQHRCAVRYTPSPIACCQGSYK